MRRFLSEPLLQEVTGDWLDVSAQQLERSEDKA